MSEDISKSDIADEVTGATGDGAETLDELVNILLDESRTESGEGSPRQEADGEDEPLPVTQDEEAVAGDAVGTASEKPGPGTQGEDPDGQDGDSASVAPRLSVIGGETDGDEDDFGDDQGYFDDDADDMLVSMPQDTTVITKGSVTMLDAETAESPSPSTRRVKTERYRVSLGATFASLFVGLAIGVVATFLAMTTALHEVETHSADEVVAIPGDVNEEQLSTEMVRYEYGGETFSLSVKDVIEETGSLESMRSGDRYSIPSAERAVEAVRNAVVLAEAQKHGIDISDGDILDYVADSYGIATVDELAQQVGLDVDETKRQLKDRLIIRSLKKEVSGDQELIPLVEPPAPDDGDPGTMTERYGEYIRSLAGDEWNSVDNVWANPDGVFSKAFEASMFDGYVASYDMARTAYDVVHHKNEEIQADIDSAWSNYLNDLFRKTHITILTLSR